METIGKTVCEECGYNEETYPELKPEHYKFEGGAPVCPKCGNKLVNHEPLSWVS